MVGFDAFATALVQDLPRGGSSGQQPENPPIIGYLDQRFRPFTMR